LAKGLASRAGEFGQVDVAVIPAFVHLDAVAQAVAGSPVSLGAQDAYFEKNGAFTGEVSVHMLLDFSVKYVLIGHSERRHIIGEKDDLLNKKLKAVLSASMIAILCVGETLEERKANKTLEVVGRQLKLGLGEVTKDKITQLVIAYEPVWAIGTGLNATPPRRRKSTRSSADNSNHSTMNPSPARCESNTAAQSRPLMPAKLLAQPDIDGPWSAARPSNSMSSWASSKATAAAKK